MVGEILNGKYRLVRLLGKGGMGAVYEAEDTESAQRLAIKVILVEGKEDTKVGTLMSRFRREVKAAMSIEGEHIVKVLDSGQDPRSDAPFMVMEYLTGEDLQALLDRLGPLPPDLALRIVTQACEGLQQAHAAGIVHRDIKPANLFLVRGDEGAITVKVLDFGIAKIKTDLPNSLSTGMTSGLTRTGSMIGSPHYMSPEQARGIKEIDHRTDLWSLGVVLYRALTGRTPYEDIHAIGDLIISICSEQPPSIQERAPWLSPEIAAVAHGALRLSTDERYPTAAAMLDALRSLLPDGAAIQEAMLVPLSEGERDKVAPKFDMTTVDDEVSRRVVKVDAVVDLSSGYATTMLNNDPPLPRSPSSAGELSPLATAKLASAQHAAATPLPVNVAARRPRWQLLVLLVAVVILTLAGLVAYVTLLPA